MKAHLIPSLVRLCGALIISSAGMACSGVAGTPASAPAPAPPVAAAAPATGASTLMQQIQAAVGDAACDTPAQCKTVAIGHKACGGPETYMAYSTKGDSSKVTSLAARYAEERKLAGQRAGAISNCMMARDPGATCSAGRCVTSGQTGITDR